MIAVAPVRQYDCMGGDEVPCERAGTEEREVAGLVVRLCAEHALELDEDDAGDAADDRETLN